MVKKATKKKTKKKVSKKKVSKQSNSNNLIEIRIHGRGGQGAKTAAQIIAEAATHLKLNVQAFPEYGPERLGAPVISYVRLSKGPIHTYSQVENPDIVLIIDHTLINGNDLSYGLKPEGTLIVNAKKLEDIKNKIKFKGKTGIVGGTKIALDEIKANKPNVPLIGAMVKLTNVITLADVKEVIRCNFLRKYGQEKMQNIQKTAQRGFDEVKLVE